jgi:hypothetical protein
MGVSNNFILICLVFNIFFNPTKIHMKKIIFKILKHCLYHNSKLHHTLINYQTRENISIKNGKKEEEIVTVQSINSLQLVHHAKFHFIFVKKVTWIHAHTSICM